MNFFKTPLFLLSFCFFCFSCNNKKQSEEPEIYAMPKKIKASKYERKEYYLPYNFIIDTGSRVYFFQQEPFFSRCGYVNWRETIAIPEYIDLQPKDLIEIPPNSIEEFIKLNILSRKDWKKHVFISSPMDIVSSSSLSRIMKVFKDTTNHVDWNFRKSTQEENFVIAYKKNPGSYYYSYNLKWDSTKTLFPEIINRIMTENANTQLYACDKFYIAKKISNKNFAKLMNSATDSASFEKLAIILKLKVEDLFAFEL